MDRLDLLLVTAFIPVFCLTFLIVIDAYSAFARRPRLSDFNKYRPELAPSTANIDLVEEILAGRRHA